MLMETISSRLNAIKKSVRASLQSEDTLKIAPYVPNKKDSGAPLSPVIYSDELHYLNVHWGNWSQASNFTSHRPFTGTFIVRIKRKLQSFIFGSLLKDYIEQEKTFMSNLVRFSNATARYVDERDKNIFWDLIRKMDNEIQHTELRNDTLIVALKDENMKAIDSLREIITKQEQRILELEEKVIGSAQRDVGIRV